MFNYCSSFKILDMVQQLFEEELSGLCGPRHARERGKVHYRAGSDRGSILAHGQRVCVRKPRVKRDEKDVELGTYSALQNYDVLCEQVLGHMIAGISSRNYEPLLDELSGESGLKKSSVSKAFVRASKGEPLMRSMGEISPPTPLPPSWSTELVLGIIAQWWLPLGL